MAPLFQSTPPARGATEYVCSILNGRLISIHAPREGGDCRKHMYHHLHEIFQSTPPARGATASSTTPPIKFANFNPRPPRGGRQAQNKDLPGLVEISIHAPREGGDPSGRLDGYRTLHFNPRPPRGGRPGRGAGRRGEDHFNPRPPRGGRQQVLGVWIMEVGISIHAPREGGDFTFGVYSLQ